MTESKKPYRYFTAKAREARLVTSPEPDPYDDSIHDIELYRYSPSNRFACDIQLRVPEAERNESPTAPALEIKDLAEQLVEKLKLDVEWLDTKYEYIPPHISDNGRGQNFMNVNILSRKDGVCTTHEAALRQATKLIVLLSRKTGIPIQDLLKHVQEHSPDLVPERDTILRSELAEYLAEYLTKHPSR